jgi:hypothetical protein
MIDDRPDESIPPVDLTSLDPRLDAGRLDLLTRTIVRDGMAARRGMAVARRPRDAMAHVARWSMPILAAAAVVVAAAIPTLAWSARYLSTAGPTQQASTDRFGIPEPIIALTRAGRDPTPADIVAAFDARWVEASR